MNAKDPITKDEGTGCGCFILIILIVVIFIWNEVLDIKTRIKETHEDVKKIKEKLK